MLGKFGKSKPRIESGLTDAIVADSEYAVVSFKPSWGLLSIAISLLSLPLRFWHRNLPWHPTQYWFNPGVMALGIVGIAVAGFFFGWLGLRSGRSRGLSKIGLFLNGTIIGVMILFTGTLLIYWQFIR